MQQKRYQVFRFLLVILAAICFLIPIVWILQTAFKNRVDIFAYPPSIFFRPTLKNFADAITEQPVLRAFLNSVIVAFSATAISMVLGASAGYAMTRFCFKGRGAVSVFILFARALPTVILIVPFFLLVQQLGIRDTRISVVLSHLSFTIPLTIWLASSYIEQMPVSLEEAAQVDGCTRVGTIFRIVVPVCAPGFAATAILVFLESWNDLTFALILTNNQAKTLPSIIISFITPIGVSWGPMFATAALVMLPSFLFLAAAGKKLTYGISMGAVKE